MINEEYVGRDGFTTRERFFQKVEISDSGCWEWTGSRKQRYGVFKYGNKSYSAHRFSYCLEYGYMPLSTEYVCHHCDNTYCVNPSHLFLGTQQDNMDDMVKKGRSPDNHGSKNPNAKLSESDVLKIREMYASGFSPSEICSAFGKPKTTINNIVRGVTWENSEYKKPVRMPLNRKLTASIAKSIVNIRSSMKLSQDRIAEMVGVSQAVVSRVLLGQAKPWDGSHE